ncbi:MAG TPA: RdgB/HAM1 family non-canonical purine NTP pyrophosphatase [Woeseiaceae bacterium]|nr:RdgB/HAM1 family non-canonical purine NTP pyrophosphatase [Woeseiaceae bacterium]
MKLPTTVVLASNNAGKFREIERLLAAHNFTIVPQSDYGVGAAAETGASFEANALIKARHAMAATGLPAIADDSGLAVDALGGRPGVYSSRYAGDDASDDDNIDRLLLELGDNDQRGAAFHCVACFVAPDLESPILTHGTWRGEVLRERRGTGGFGYDPVFLDTASGRTSAELSPEEKNERSHRGMALRELARALAARYDR